jgi:hypothetical protein
MPPRRATEPEKAVERPLAPPIIEPEHGFKATVLVPPGHIYDPLFMVPSGKPVWINDDGGEEGEHGGRIFAVTHAGRVSTLVDNDRLLPIESFDIAPSSFGSYGGKILALAQPKVGLAGPIASHVVLLIDPQTQQPASRVCTLLSRGPINRRPGVDAPQRSVVDLSHCEPRLLCENIRILR